MQILLVNDDGIDSPALIPTIEELEKIGEVTTIVPMFQQSWTSKANTRRRRDLKKEIRKLNGKEIIALDALPSDCANYGIYEMDQIDMLVSGANVGHNVGLGAFYSSGTVGAALEGLILGIPSVSISVPYTANSELIPEPFKRAVHNISKLIDSFAHRRKQEFGMMMLNLPYNVEEKEIIATKVQKFAFGKLFYNDRDGIVQPTSYPDLDYPTEEQIEEHTDVWARHHKKGSLVMLDHMGQFIDYREIQDWLNNENLQEI